MQLARHVSKYDLVPQIMDRTGSRSLLDVGCRDNVLRKRMCQLRPDLAATEYLGADLIQNPEGGVDFVGDFTQGIPLEDSSVDLVAAFDVLEHVDDLQKGLHELARVSRKAVAITLPNLAHAMFRLRFLRRGWLSAKYDLAYGYGPDRHRWVTVLPQTDRYMERFAQDNGFGLHRSYLKSSDGRWKLRLMEDGLQMAGAPPVQWAWTALYLFSR